MLEATGLLEVAVLRRSGMRTDLGLVGGNVHGSA